MTVRKTTAAPAAPPAEVAAYLSNLAPEIRARVERIRAQILKSVPQACEGFSYRMPAYKLHGRPLLYVAAFKEHIGLYPMTGGIKDAFAAQLSPYGQSTGTVRFRHDTPVPYALVGRLAKYRAHELTQKLKPKAPRSRDASNAGTQTRPRRKPAS